MRHTRRIVRRLLLMIISRTTWLNKKQSYRSVEDRKALPEAMIVAVLLVSVTAVKWTIDGN